MHTETEELSQRTTVEELVSTYMKAEREIRAACAQIASAMERLNAVVKLGEISGDVSFRPAHRREMDYSDPADALTELRRQIWHRLADRLELRRMMSVQRAKELDVWLAAPIVEPITLETVLGLQRYYTENLEGMLEEAIGEVYDFLRPVHTKLKTNTQYELKSKVILEGWVEYKGITNSGYWPNSYRRPHLVALENVFSALDGRGNVTRSHYSELEQKIPERGVGETRYFRYECFRNGNLHLVFKRKDLVVRFNAMAGGKRLKPEHA